MTTRGVFSAFLDLLFPPRCVACRRPGTWLCSSCLAGVERIVPPLCPLCGEPLPAGLPCPRTGYHLAHLDGLRSAAWHSGPLRTAIHQYKYRSLRALAEPLGAVLLAAWQREPLPADRLMPVPLHERRIRERGFNQSVLLAQHLGQACGIAVDSVSLRRTRHTEPQVNLSAAERLANVQGAFAYQGPLLRDQAICLIDDVCTTGATLEACAAALRQAGARSVYALTLARPRWDRRNP